MRILSIVAAAGLSLAAGSSFAASGNGPAGEWVVADHTAVVRIAKCGGGYCGFVAKGQAGKDYHNPDPRKRNRPLVGIEVFFNMRPNGENSWVGQTYNADDGQMYSGRLTLAGPGTLQVEGCVEGGGPCGSQTWSRER